MDSIESMRASNLKLYPFQRDGVAFLTSDWHKLLADDMGLGKTIQVIAAMDAVQARSVVIICPATIKIHWARKIHQFSHYPHSIFVVSSGKDKIPAGCSVVIVNYDLLVDRKRREGKTVKSEIHRQLVARGHSIGFDVGVIDEAHFLKELSSSRTKKILGAGSFLHSARYKWALTGTPVLNRPAEIFPLLYTLAPDAIAPHSTWRLFAERFCDGRDDRKCRKCGAFLLPKDERCPRCDSGSIDRYSFNARGHSNVVELAERMKGFMLRRRKEDVLDQLPDKVETIIELDVNPPSSLDDEYIATVRRELAMAKVPLATAHIATLLGDIDKVVVFAHHRDVIETLADNLERFNPVICYGGMTADRKQVSIDQFINNPDVRIFIAQTAAGGTGVDGLQSVCSHVVFVELDWSPGVMDQAVDRLRRIGQRETVFVQYLAVPDSLDTVMANVNDAKRQVINQLIKSDEVTYTMSLESILERIAVALEAIAAGGGAVAAAPAKAPKGGSKKPPAADPAVSTAPAAPAASAGPTEEEIRQAAGAFIAASPSKEVGRDIINKQIWPQFGATALTNLKPEHYAAALAEIKKSPEAFLATADDGLGV